MGLFLNHINTVLAKNREPRINALTTDNTLKAFDAQEAVRRAVKRIWNKKQWSFKYRSPTFQTVSGTSAYIVPRLVGETFKFMSANAPYDLTVVSEDLFNKKVPNPTATGNPQYVRLFEMVGVETQPTSASVITVVSSNTTDTTQVVLIKGLVGGYLDYEQVPLNGTTSVLTTKSFSAIYAVTKSDVTAGYVTLTSNGAAVTNVVLQRQDLVSRLRILRLYPTPDSAITITVKGFGKAPELSHAYEDTEIPTDWDYVVDQWGHALYLQYLGQEKQQEATNQINIANSMLDDDMANEERISSEELIVPQRFGGTGDGWMGWSGLPAGYGVTEGY